ncbi:MAG: ATP-dependent Clp protease proteolytic subunit [Flavobacteriales bacterium]
MEKHEQRIGFSAAAKREGRGLTLVLSGYIWTDNSNASAKIAEALLSMEEGDDLTVLLRNLYGGDTDESLTIYHDLKGRKPKMKIDGAVCSSATFIMLAGDGDIEASEHSKGMTHRPEGGASGDFEDMRSRADQNEAVYNEIAAIYAERTGLTPDECKALFMPKGKDVWFTAAKMKELGLVDVITKGSLLTGTVAVKELRKERDPQNILERFAACLAEDEVPTNDPKQSPMKETAKKLGLPETATEAEINAALDTRLTKGDSAAARVLELEGVENTRMETEFKELVEGAVKSNAITAAKRDELIAKSKGNVAVSLDLVKGLIEGLKPHAPVSAQLGAKDAAAVAKEADRAAWSYQEYMMKDPKALEKMRNQDSAAFTKLKQAHVEYLKDKRNG